MTFQKKKVELMEALPKIRTYCNYRDRCHKEVKQKLYDIGLWKQDVEQALVQMIEEGLLNEERYAKSYARGHFYNKKWGKYRITQELKQRQIHPNLIEVALREIEEDDYEETVKKLIVKKAKDLKGNRFEVQQKVSRYLVQKGYRFNEFSSLLKEEMEKRG